MRRSPPKPISLLVTTALLLGAAAPLAAVPCPENAYNDFNGPRNLYLNLHNCGLDCSLQELPYLRLIRDGVTGARIAPVPLDNTSPGEPDFFLVNPFDPYFDGVLEIFGPENVLVLIDDGVDEGPFAKPSPNDMLRKLTSLLERHPEVRHIELMNEPSNFSDISPEEYVARYLRPARRVIDEYNADRPASQRLVLYSAAWFGDEGGLRETQRMVRAGALAYVDVLTAHIYDNRVADVVERARAYRRLARGKPVAVTETNFNASNSSDYDTQQWWVCQAMSGMEQVLRRGLSPAGQALQHNVLYTLRADEERRFNLISFPDLNKFLFWNSTGPGHFVITERSQVPTDPKSFEIASGAPGEEPPGSDPPPDVPPPAAPPPGGRTPELGGPGSGRP